MGFPWSEVAKIGVTAVGFAVGGPIGGAAAGALVSGITTAIDGGDWGDTFTAAGIGALAGYVPGGLVGGVVGRVAGQGVGFLRGAAEGLLPLGNLGWLPAKLVGTSALWKGTNAGALASGVSTLMFTNSGGSSGQPPGPGSVASVPTRPAGRSMAGTPFKNGEDDKQQDLFDDLAAATK